LSTKYFSFPNFLLNDINESIFQVLSDENGKRKGIYNNSIIQKAVNKMWFMNKRDEGIAYKEYFNPMPIPAIALILTAVSDF
jgi:uncharacterized protein DUF6532